MNTLYSEDKQEDEVIIGDSTVRTILPVIKKREMTPPMTMMIMLGVASVTTILLILRRNVYLHVIRSRIATIERKKT